VAEISGPESARIQQLEDQMARLLLTLDQQRADYEQRLSEQQAKMERQQARLNEQQAEIADLRVSRRGQQRSVSGTHRTRRASNRRALLKWGGAAAAAAAVTLVASEQSAHAASAADGGNLIIGQANAGTNQTSLAVTGTSTAGYFFQVDASLSTITSAVAITGISNVTTGTGVYGTSTGSSGTGVSGFSPSSNGIGMLGVNSNVGVGVGGLAGSNGTGVAGDAPGSVGYGVWGESDSGYGVVGEATSGIDVHVGGASGTGRLQQKLQASSGAPSSGTHNSGEQVRDSLGDLYLCVGGGSPGTWTKVAAIPAGKPGGALVFLPKPFRIFDTRPGVAGCPIDPGVPMASASVTTLQVTGTASTLDSTLVVPTGATGIIGDLLAINVNGNGITGGFAGFLTLQPHNVTPTGNSFLHYYPSTVQHNSVVIGLDATGKLDVGNYNTSTNVGLDILGYII
jgi:hypothetical protein